MGWMAWTVPTAIFFAFIATLLAGMTVWEIRSPSIPRRGLLPMTTTRGDRLFVGLLACAFVALAWVGFTDAPAAFALIPCAAFLFSVGRWG